MTLHHGIRDFISRGLVGLWHSQNDGGPPVVQIGPSRVRTSTLPRGQEWATTDVIDVIFDIDNKDVFVINSGLMLTLSKE